MKRKGFPKLRTRGFFWLPSALTTGGLFSAFYAIIAAMQAKFEISAIAIFVAMIMDGLDGRVARITHSESEFGAEYDSLADMVSFGVAPAILAYNWNLDAFGKLGWLVAFIYCAAAALRLARFNTMHAIQDKRYFQGFPSPAAAGVIASLVWVGSQCEVVSWTFGFLVVLITLSVGLLMVSQVRFYSFKELEFVSKIPYTVAFFNVMIIIAIALHPPIMLFTIFMLYLLSGPIFTHWRWRMVRKSRGKRS